MDGMYFFNSGVRAADVTDGTSNTIALGERYHRDSTFDKLYPSAPIAQQTGWAWDHSPSLSLYLACAGNSPINWVIPPGTTSDPSPHYLEWQRLSTWGSGHAGGANFAFTDGSVHFLTNGTNVTTVLIPLSTRAGGETIPDAEGW
jgi:prepilin-type processing-associated H-X9-DG protein